MLADKVNDKKIKKKISTNNRLFLEVDYNSIQNNCLKKNVGLEQKNIKQQFE